MTGNGEKIYEVLLEGPLLSRDRMCDEMLGWCSKPVIQEIDLHQAVDKILSNKPAETKDDNFINNLYEQIGKSEHERQVLKAFHLTDIHLDLDYKVGTVDDCGDPICCREEYGYPESGQEAAG